MRRTGTVMGVDMDIDMDNDTTSILNITALCRLSIEAQKSNPLSTTRNLEPSPEKEKAGKAQERGARESDDERRTDVNENENVTSSSSVDTVGLGLELNTI